MGDSGIKMLRTSDDSDIGIVINTRDLKFLNKSSIRKHRNRNLSDWAIDNLDPDGTHVVCMTMVHNDVEMRLWIMLKMKDVEVKEGYNPPRAFLDISFEEYNALARIRKNEETGEYERVL